MTTVAITSAQYSLRDPDVRLMLRVREDEPGAFEDLVKSYQNRLLAVMKQVCGNAQEAEDLAQEVFLRVYRARKEYHPQAKFATWLFTIANNLALNSLRRRHRKPTVPLDVPDSGSLPLPAATVASHREPSPSGALRQQELAGIIQQALSHLNERQRMAVMLNKFEDMGYEEIAAVLQTTTQAVKSLLMRARTQLRELLKDYVEGNSE